MNYLFETKVFHNRYFIMRHGHSLANQERIVVSHAANAVDRYGLTEMGRNQVHASLRLAQDLNSETRIFSSDFKRARETAEILHRGLGCQRPIVFARGLRERDFGTFEFCCDRVYDEVWREDSSNPDSRCGDAESANQVMTRVTTMIAEFEQRYSDRSILLVSHGDTLQILQTACERQNASWHRRQTHLQTAEIRLLKLAPTDPMGE